MDLEQPNQHERREWNQLNGFHGKGKIFIGVSCSFAWRLCIVRLWHSPYRALLISRIIVGSAHGKLGYPLDLAAVVPVQSTGYGARKTSYDLQDLFNTVRGRLVRKLAQCNDSDCWMRGGFFDDWEHVFESADGGN